MKKFIGITIQAAKKSARQMYGDNLKLLLDTPADDNRKPALTIFSNKKEQENFSSSEDKSGQSDARADKNGVKFERTNRDITAASGVNSNLLALRKYAEKQSRELKGNAADGENTSAVKKKGEENEKKPGLQNCVSRENITRHYSRANIRSSEQISNAAQNSLNGHFRLPEEKQEPGTSENTLYSYFDSPEAISPDKPATPSGTDYREIQDLTVLHSRFDKLESLLDSTLISASLDYASHPAFQQLVHTGISTCVVSDWFRRIIREGVDPLGQTEEFMTKLSAIIKDAIDYAATGNTQKYLLFTGPSGSGKTRLVMKLALGSEFMKQKKTAVVSLIPQSEDHPCYYTILGAFCSDHKIPYFEVKNSLDVVNAQKKWKAFDHVLIDTPSISMKNKDSFHQYWSMRQIFSSLASLEIHLVVNASYSHYQLVSRQAEDETIQPDYLAFSHLDEVTQWGPIIPFLKRMNCPVKYVSKGDDMKGSIDHFNPAWLAQNVLQ